MRRSWLCMIVGCLVVGLTFMWCGLIADPLSCNDTAVPTSKQLQVTTSQPPQVATSRPFKSRASTYRRTADHGNDATWTLKDDDDTEASLKTNLLKKDVKYRRLNAFENGLLHGHAPAALEVEIKKPAAGSPIVEPPRHKIAVVFFGLVKTIVKPQAAAWREYVATPLLAHGTVDVFLHTFQQTTFRNPRHGENATTVFNQSRSISILKNVFAEARRFDVISDHVAAAHKFFGPTPYYLPGNWTPWGNSSRLSMHYFLRQQFSLLRATEMWTGTLLTRKEPKEPLTISEVETPTVTTTLRDNEYSCVLYIRPDLTFDNPIPADVLRSMCRSDNHGHRELTVPLLEYEGLNDRTAIGTPEAMFLYGLRGMRLHAFVEAGGLPNAEPFLLRYLCSNHVATNIAPWIVRRVRGSGDVENRDIRKDYLVDAFVKTVEIWRRVAYRVFKEKQANEAEYVRRTSRDANAAASSSFPQRVLPSPLPQRQQHPNCLPKAIFGF